MEDRLLFVYGTLRRGAGSGMHRLLVQAADFLGEASYRGMLYRIAHYPGAVPSGDPADLVAGEVYRLRTPETTLPLLDRYEECGPGFPEPAVYVRRIQEVRLVDGETVSVWIYLYNRPTEGLSRIPSGDFLDH